MKKQTKRRLALVVETIHPLQSLEPQQLHQVNGGLKSTQFTCTGCPSGTI